MNYLKKTFVIILTPLLLNLFSSGPVWGSSPLPEKTDKTEHEPRSRVILQKDIPGEKESWLSKYKWWIVGGVVLIAGAAAAGGGGGGGGGSETPTEQPNDKGDYIVSW